MAGTGTCHGSPAKLGPPLAAIFSEVGKQLSHGLDMDGIADEPSLPRGDEKTRLQELLQVKRSSGWADADMLGDLRGGQTRWAGSHQEGERTKHLDSELILHATILQKSLYYANVKLVGGRTCSHMSFWAQALRGTLSAASFVVALLAGAVVASFADVPPILPALAASLTLAGFERGGRLPSPRELPNSNIAIGISW